MLVDNGLLRIRPEDRIKATDLHGELERINRLCKKGQMHYFKDVSAPPIPWMFNQPVPTRDSMNKALRYTSEGSR
jgi:hypothetical protein